QPDAELVRRLRIDRDPDLSRPRIVRLLADADLARADGELGAVAAIEMHRHEVVAGRIEIAADRGDQPRHVHRAAWAGMPDPTLVVTVALQGVLVEIVGAVA